MWSKIFEIASHVDHPVTLAAFGAVLAAYLFSVATKGKQLGILWLLAAGVLLLAISPLLSSTYLQARGLYRVRVSVLGVDKRLVDNARVISSIGGELKKVEGGWEFDIPPQSRPADGRLKLSASVENAFLAGDSALVLDGDYFPSVEIQLGRDTSAILRGTVVDERRNSVAGAQVSIEGNPNILTITDAMGNFALPAHAADGQMVGVLAQKDQMSGRVYAQAGTTPVELTVKRR